MHRARLSNLAARLWRRSDVPAIHRRSIAGRGSLVYGPDVAAALEHGLPIVALESAIITHGMPYPDNLNTALKVEDAIRKQGVVPATIGLINGKVYVGLNNEQLEALSKADSARTMKCSRRDISFILSHGLNGGTTVSGTMLIAHAAGIPIMATGGIGGVHRGAELTLDISADLIELGRTPVAVVCSGVKSILDIGKTLEYLETQGVPVVKIGETPEFPAFYCSETSDKIKAPCRVSNAKEAAGIVETQGVLGINTGILFAVSIPEKYSLQPSVVNTAISEALKKADAMRITGKQVTPFLLSELNVITRGQSLEANVALVENNARIAAEIALNLCEKTAHTRPASVRMMKSKQKPTVIGASVLDTVLQVKEPEINHDGGTYNGRSRRSCGGVGRNVADALLQLGLENTRLISVVGDDEQGKAILESLGAGGETVKRTSDVDTARFTVVVDVKGECRFCVSEIEPSFAAITPRLIKEYRSHLEEASLIVLDANLELDTMRYVLDVASQANVPVWYEPTDVKKAARIFQVGPQWRDVLHFVSPNQNELRVIGEHFDIPVTADLDLQAAARSVAEQLAEHIPVVVTTLGAQGVMVTRKASQDRPFYDERGRLIADSSVASRFYPVVDGAERTGGILSVSGCGDCLTAGIIYGIHEDLDEIGCVSVALRAAALSLRSYDAVPRTLRDALRR